MCIGLIENDQMQIIKNKNSKLSEITKSVFFDLGQYLF